MRTIWNSHLLMDTAGDASGGGGNGTLLTTPTGGSGAAGATGGTTPPPPPAAGGTATGNNPNAGGSAGGANTSWRSALPQELQAEPSLQTFNDISALAKSYIHAQKAIGADKIVVPGKLSTEDDWKQVYSKLGLPADIKDYDVKMKESTSINKDFVEKFKTTAHAAGVLPQQAQKLADWFQEINGQSEQEVMRVRGEKVKADIESLKGEWGAAFDKNITIAGQVLRDAGDPELIKYLDETGLGNDTKLVKLLSKIGQKYLGEEKIVGGNKEFANVRSPKEALAEANKIMGNFDHPYHKKDHPNHKAAVQEVQDLFAQAYISDKK